MEKCIKCGGDNTLAILAKGETKVKLCFDCVVEVQKTWEPVFYTLVSRPKEIQKVATDLLVVRGLQDHLKKMVERKRITVGQLKAIHACVGVTTTRDIPENVVPMVRHAFDSLADVCEAFRLSDPKGVKDIHESNWTFKLFSESLRDALREVVEYGSIKGFFNCTRADYTNLLTAITGFSHDSVFYMYERITKGKYGLPVEDHKDKKIVRPPEKVHYYKVCDECGSEFKTTFPTKKRCSTDCANKGMQRMALANKRTRTAAKLEAESKMGRGWEETQGVGI